MKKKKTILQVKQEYMIKITIQAKSSKWIFDGIGGATFFIFDSEKTDNNDVKLNHMVKFFHQQLYNQMY